MDYKIIILFLSIIVLVCTIVYFILENNTTKKLIEDKYKNMIHFIDVNIKNMHNKTTTELGKFGNKIKKMNDDCIQKIRKMNALGSQPITNISNHYSSESDTDNENNIIKYLSDVKKINSTLYMSDMNVKKTNIPFKIIISEDCVTENSESSVDSKINSKISVLSNNIPEQHIENTENAGNIKSLKPLDEYTLEQLILIAKQSTIPTFIKDNEQRRELNKEELYDIIKENIINNL